MTKEVKSSFSYRIMQASPTELIVILYEMTQVYITESINYLKEGNVLEFRNNLRYAQRVINELNCALDLKYPISLDLMQLYMFLIRTFIKASSKKEDKDLIRCINILEKLKSSFNEVAKEDKRGPMMQNTQQVYAGLTYSKGNLNETFGLESNRGYRV